MHGLNSRRWAWCLALLLALNCLSVAQAQLVSVTMAGVDSMLENVKYGLKMAGKEDVANQIDSLLEAFLQSDGFKGIDTKKPAGAYLNKFPSNPTQPGVVVFIPVSNEADFISFLGKLNINPSKEEKGVRSIDIPTGQRLFLAFKFNHAFVSLDEDEVKNPSDPAKLTSSLTANGILAVSVNLKEIPDDLKDKLLQQAKQQMEEEAKREKQGDAYEKQVQLAGTKLAYQSFEHLVRDSEKVQFVATLDKASHVFTINTNLQAKSGSGLYQEIKKMSDSQSKLSSLLDNAPVSMVSHGILNEVLRADLDKMLDGLVKKAISEEKSLVKKAVAEKVFQALEPTLKSKTYEFAMGLKAGGDNQPMTGIAALRVKDGKKIEEMVKGLFAEIKEKAGDAVKLDADKVNGVNLHIINVPENDKGHKEMVEAFGAARIVLAFHDDHLVAAIGKESVEQVKKFLAQPASGTNPPPMQLLVHVKPLARFVKEAKVKKAFETVFTTPDSDVIKVNVTGGESLSVKATISTHFLKLIDAAEKAKGE
jgi:hypothetical protein